MFPTMFIPRNFILTPDTYIYFRIDGTGSMGAMRTTMQTVVGDLLKDELLPYYLNDSDWYDAHVSLFTTADSNDGERGLRELNIAGAPWPAEFDRIVVVWLCDESTPYGAGNGDTFNPNGTRTANYNTDVAALRGRVDALGAGKYAGAFIEIDTAFDGPYELFLQTIRDGNGSYSGVNGLSDRSEFVYRFDVPVNTSATDMLEVVREVLNSMGVTF
jgi:hypothetical protein